MNCSLYTTLYTSIHDRNSSLSGVSGARVTCIESNSTVVSTVQSDGSVHGQPRIEPRPLPSSPSVLTNTLTCTVRLYCNYSCSLNKKYRQFGELPFQVSMLSASCMHACGISFRRRHVKERFKSENFPPFWILLILDVFLMHVPVPAAYGGGWRSGCPF